MVNTNNSEDRPRLPPGQHKIRRFPVLQKGSIAHVNRDEYALSIEGEVNNPKRFDLNTLIELQDREITEDIHCVTSWSKFDTTWKGISFEKLFEIVKPKPTANFIEFTCADGGFTTTVPIERTKVPNTLLALSYEGKPINDKHGGPVRAVIPNLYFYKSAKWVKKITFLREDRLGYWERGGYSNKADPWKEQRYSHQD
ncbi:MAG: molybdopterin-dependent oxidoreductase [Candidatus Lokiarchaeota archaeon]|nr:molybdopterin-dependent oxidoreductase [Candidatus Lokiarchaeota archaeon]MBD3199915.1 molybdopterin-dependent oxidoreductase [Candidatus Lokiarchaeota archaeon]